MTNDIVARLRESDGGYFMRRMFAEAADEIERLRKENAILFAEHDALRAERDEARREVCAIYADTYGSVGIVAEQRGWDCFKENNNG